MPRPPRKKPWYRLRNVVFAFIGLVIFTVGYQIIWAVTARPGAPVNYGAALHELALKQQPPGNPDDDGWPEMVIAIELATQSQEELRTRWQGDPNAAPLIDFSIIPMTLDPANTARTGVPDETQEQFDARRAWNIRQLTMYEQAGVFDHLGRAAAKPRMVPPAARYDGPLKDILLPELGSLRNLTRANNARVFLAMQAGHESKIPAIFEQNLAIARMSMGEPLLISRLVGIAVSVAAFNAVEDVVADHKLSPTTLRGLLAAFERQTRTIPSMQYSFTGERSFMLDIIQRCCTDDGHGNGRLLLTEASELESGVQAPGVGPFKRMPRIANAASIVLPSKRELDRVANRFHDQIASLSRMPARDRQIWITNPEAEINALPKTYFLLRLLTPALSRALQSDDEYRVRRSAFPVVVALELYTLEHNGPPAALDDLVPAYLEHLPEDEFAKDGKFIYKRLEQPKADGGRYLLYSVGPDGKDDGGVDPLNLTTAYAPHQSWGVGPTVSAGRDLLFGQKQRPNK